VKGIGNVTEKRNVTENKKFLHIAL